MLTITNLFFLRWEDFLKDVLPFLIEIIHCNLSSTTI